LGRHGGSDVGAKFAPEVIDLVTRGWHLGPAEGVPGEKRSATDFQNYRFSDLPKADAQKFPMGGRNWH